jgi:NAD(P)-dependent dehydrogenase (short-subunit alcohol dehydrogenase family)
VADYDASKAGIAQVEADLGPIEVVVANAGITRDAPFHKMTPEQWKEVIDTNLTGVFNTVHPVWPGMRERKFGRVIVISSINGQKGQFGQVNYAATKAGDLGIVKSLAQEGARAGITANAICPGYIGTEMVMARCPKRCASKIIRRSRPAASASPRRSRAAWLPGLGRCGLHQRLDDLGQRGAVLRLSRALAPGVADGFVTLAAAWRAAKRTGDSAALTVTAGPAFTAKWLAPRLFAFASAHPEIELRFTASLRLMDFDRDDIDVAIRFGLPRAEPGLSMHVLSREWMTPMMTPQMAEIYASPSDLARAPLLSSSDLDFLKPAANWSAWFRAANLPPRFSAGTRFSQADHALDAALRRGCGAGPDHACRTRPARRAPCDALRHRPDDRGGLPGRISRRRQDPPTGPNVHRLAGRGGEGPRRLFGRHALRGRR